MSIVANRRHIVAKSPSYSSVMQLRFCCALHDLVTLSTLSLRSRYDLATNNALPRRLCFFGIVNLGASATLPLRSWRTGKLQAWFKCSPKVGVALFDPRTNSEWFHSHVIGPMIVPTL